MFTKVLKVFTSCTDTCMAYMYVCVYKSELIHVCACYIRVKDCILDCKYAQAALFAANTSTQGAFKVCQLTHNFIINLDTKLLTK